MAECKFKLIWSIKSLGFFRSTERKVEVYVVDFQQDELLQYNEIKFP